MMPLVVYVILSVSGSLVAGMPRVIHRTEVTSIVGENVTLSCQLPTDNEVLQVTWQKEGPTTANMATYSTHHSPRLLGSYHEHVRVTQSDLNSSAITLDFVTLEDEGCYRCIFSIFPIGPVQGRMCLSVYAISEPQVDAQFLTGEEGEVLVASCSVTGKPAPEITWDLPDGLVVTPHLSHVWNPDKTVTIISNFTYVRAQLPQKWTTMCLIRHPILNIGIELKDPSQESTTGSQVILCVSLVSVSIIVSLLVLCFCCLQKQKMGTHKVNEDLLVAVSWITTRVCCRRYSTKVPANITKSQRTWNV
ncbi:OX-2 membrane glycoprotein-like [Gracilinanus agilis]|uniref:OX-2 membrane glycoprotein-like n=1 Tax=Gracilinanus agilis TaxID=191870 RepID=UPI001CFD2BEC|nr:OX-2 membrane glycoprotein-like [Gracilinanus agilis]